MTDWDSNLSGQSRASEAARRVVEGAKKVEEAKDKAQQAANQAGLDLKTGKKLTS